MKTLVAFLFLGSLGLAWCIPEPGAFNIARTGEASQSSDYPVATPQGYAYKAIDSVKDANWDHGYCSHTSGEYSPWWRLDMKKKYKVKIVVITGRSDCCLERMEGTEVRIGNLPDNNNPVCGRFSSTPNLTTTFSCNGMEGQYLSVVIPGRIQYLTICELEVYGDPVNQICFY